MSQTNENAAPIQDQTPLPVVITPEKVIEDAVKSFSETEVTNAKIDEIKEYAGKLSITGVDDKVGYKKVDTARKRIKALRGAVSKKETELLELPKNFTAKVKAEAKRLIDLLKPIEDDLQLKQKAIDDIILEQKRKAEAAKAAEAQKIKFREKTLFDLGALRNGENNFILGEWVLVPEKIAAATEEEFSLLVKAIEQTLPKPAASEPIPVAADPKPAQATQQPQNVTPVPAATISLPTQRRPAAAATQPPSTQADDLRFVAGFEDARRKVLELLNNPEKTTRAELINKINNLKP